MAGKWKPAPLPDGSYADSARPFTSQDVCNLIPEFAENPHGRGPVKLVDAPGLKEFASMGTKHRGIRNVEGKLFVVSGSTLYQVATTGAVTTLGTIPGTGRVSMTHNQITNGNELLIVNGTAGYIWNTVTSTLTRITDPGYPGAIVADYIDSLFIQIEPQRRYFFNSDLADGTSYNTNETYEGESAPDRMVSLKVNHGEVLLFSETTTEVFEYTGTTNALFQNKGIVIPYGCGSTHSVANLDNSTFFLGADGSVYRLTGYDATRISTHAIEQDIATCQLSKAYAFTFEDLGHKVYYLTFPDGHTWGYDCATQKWHRRSSYGLYRWRLATLVRWNNAWYGGEYNTGRLFRLDWDYMLEGCDEHVRGGRTGVAHDNQNRMIFNGLEFVIDTGGESSVCAPVFTLEFVEPLTAAGNLADCAVGDVISYQYRTRGGTSPVTFAITSGALPAGLSMDSAGLVTGTTTTAYHDNAWTVTATDSEGTTAALADTAYVLDMLGTPPNSHASTAYSYALTGTAGTAPYTFALTTGTLPPGLSLSSAGVISGTTGATLASYPFTVTMTDAAGVDTVKTYGIQITDATAATLAPFITRWYTFDNTLLDTAGAGGWTQTYGGGITYETGVKSQQLVPTHEMREVASVVGAGGNWSMAFWLTTSGTTSSTCSFGRGYNTGGGTDPWASISIAGDGAGLSSASVYAWDTAIGGFVSSSVSSLPGLRVLVCLIYTEATKTLELTINGAAFKSIVLGAALGANGTQALFMRNNSGGAFAPINIHPDEWSIYNGHVLTVAEQVYLYNGGTGKSHAELIADSLL